MEHQSPEIEVACAYDAVMIYDGARSRSAVVCVSCQRLAQGWGQEGERASRGLRWCVILHRRGGHRPGTRAGAGPKRKPRRTREMIESGGGEAPGIDLKRR